MLVDHDVDVNISNNTTTPLMKACQLTNNFDIVQMLLSKKPNVNLLNRFNESALTIATKFQNSSIV